jgi:hypothetical protein
MDSQMTNSELGIPIEANILGTMANAYSSVVDISCLILLDDGEDDDKDEA